MNEQLRLDVEAEAPIVPVNSQLRELPGTEWEHIFGMAAPGDDADAAISRSNTQEGDA